MQFRATKCNLCNKNYKKKTSKTTAIEIYTIFVIFRQFSQTMQNNINSNKNLEKHTMFDTFPVRVNFPRFFHIFRHFSTNVEIPAALTGISMFPQPLHAFAKNDRKLSIILQTPAGDVCVLQLLHAVPKYARK